MMLNHCVYTHTSPSGKVYVGQTVNTKRRWGYNGEHYKNKKSDGKYVQEAFARAIEKYGWESFEHSIVLDGISKKEADYTEKYLIKWYKLHNSSYNITDGGEGTCGIKRTLSLEEKEAIRERLIANPPMKGKHHSEETKQKISKAVKGKKLSEERRIQMSNISKGKKHSDESKAKIREYKKSHPETWIGGWNREEVHQYDLQGNYIASFPSAMEAAATINKNISSDILSCIKGKIASAGGYLWRKEKTSNIDMSKYRILETSKGTRVYDISEEGRLRRSAAHGKAINQYSIDGHYLATFCSASEAARQTNSNLSGINRCCKHLPKYRTASGYRWEFDNIENRRDIRLQQDDARLKEKQINKTAAKKS